MLKSKKKVLALTISALILLLSFGTTSYAQTIQSALKAQFVSFKILWNGSQVTPKDSQGNTVQPLLVNGTTYLPIRAFGDLFDKNVDFNNSLKQISITDKPNNEVESLKAQINQKDNEILLLKAQITALEDELDDKKNKKDIDDIISDVEDDLEDIYDIKSFGKKNLGNNYIAFDSISLDGDEDDIEIEIELDLRDFYDEGYDWYDDIDVDDITDFLQDICDEIWDVKELKKADIEGTIYDHKNKKLDSFSARAGKSVKLD